MCKENKVPALCVKKTKDQFGHCYLSIKIVVGISLGSLHLMGILCQIYKECIRPQDQE